MKFLRDGVSGGPEAPIESKKRHLPVPVSADVDAAGLQIFCFDGLFQAGMAVHVDAMRMDTYGNNKTIA